MYNKYGTFPTCVCVCVRAGTHAGHQADVHHRLLAVSGRPHPGRHHHGLLQVSRRAAVADIDPGGRGEGGGGLFSGLVGDVLNGLADDVLNG